MAQFGKIAREFGGKRYPLRVLQSAAGYYLGTVDDEGPYSRESVEYWPDQSQAEGALETGDWTQREAP